MVRHLHEKRFVVVEETAGLLAAAVVLLHPVLVLLVVEAGRSPRSMVSWPQQQLLTPSGALVYGLNPNQHCFALTDSYLQKYIS